MDMLTAEVRKYWERQSCGTDDAVSAKHSKAYFEEIEEARYRYDPYIHGFAQFSRWHDKDVLEVGVGAGSDFLQFVRSGARAHGVDLTLEAIANVEARLRVYGLQAADLRQCNAEQLPYPDNHFDLAYSHGVIHHAENTKDILREMVRVTKPGGTVKVMVYSRWCYYTIYMFLRYGIWRFKGIDWVMAHHQESPGTKVYTPRTLREDLLSGIPHEDLRITSYDSIVSGRFRALREFLIWLTPPKRHWFLCFEFRKP
jgi:SAM-dependent methyltransferase